LTDQGAVGPRSLIPGTVDLEKILLRYGATLLEDLTATLRDDQDARELLQEVLAASLLAVERGSVIRDWRKYLYTACSRLAAKYIEKTQARESSPLDLLQKPEVRLDAETEAMQILKLVGRRLDGKGRLVLGFILQGYHCGEMMTLTGFCRHTIERRVSKIRALTRFYWNMEMPAKIGHRNIPSDFSIK
jgi:DNA-directed RNA polymerase specialized sigma24 family protein